jgi:hypothetical protein
VVKFAVYVYFALSLIACQELSEHPMTVFPIFLVLKFIFFAGWLEVAEAIENPFGNDEDDFQVRVSIKDGYNNTCQVCELLSRHVWAVSRSLNQFRGPPVEEEGEEEEEDEEKEEGEEDKKHVVTLTMDLHRKT